MRAALRSAAVASHAGQFVWLDLNCDDPRNAAFLSSHFNMGYPLLLIVDPDTAAVTRMLPGSAPPAQLVEFLRDATARPSGPADEALQRGDALLGAGDDRGAAAAYDQALSAGGALWKRHDHAIEQLIGALQVNDRRTCVARGATEASRMPRGHEFVNVAGTAVSCLAAEPTLIASEPGHQLEALAGAALSEPSASEDDHYQIFEALYAIRHQAGDDAGGHALAERYLDYVDHRPAATSDDEHMARDLARLRAAIKLGTPERVIPALEASERTLPRDENASARLASAYTAAHRYPDAIAACTRGLARGAGPGGTQRLLSARASAEAKAGDLVAARRDLDAALAAASRIPVVTLRDFATTQVRSQLDALGASAPH